MHTYMRHEDGGYTVGMWLPDNEEGMEFYHMLDVPDIGTAITLVNILNGGTGTVSSILEIVSKRLEIIKEH